MVGFVLIANAHRYGAFGIGGGIGLCLFAAVLGTVCFRNKRN